MTPNNKSRPRRNSSKETGSSCERYGVDFDQTNDCLARGAIACESSRELLRKLPDPE